MSFTYIGDLSTDLDEIRFKVNDTSENSGPKPLGANFTDEEINGLLTIEGSNDRTVAAIYENLAVVWASKVDTEVGARRESASQASKQYKALAKQQRDDYGFGSAQAVLTTGFATRKDGYSDDIDSSEA